MDYVEKLSRDNAAVILVDLLDGFLPGLRTIGRGNFFRKITDHVDHAMRVERHTPSAWDETAFRDALAATGRRKMVLEDFERSEHCSPSDLNFSQLPWTR